MHEYDVIADWYAAERVETTIDVPSHDRRC
jgi:hypothetical protein